MNIGRLWIQLKTLLAVKSAVGEIKEAKMKAGITSTEFWAVVLTQAVNVVLALWGIIPQDVLLKVMLYSSVVSGVYVLARAIVKATASKADDAAFNKILAALKPLLDKVGVPTEAPLPTDEQAGK